MSCFSSFFLLSQISCSRSTVVASCRATTRLGVSAPTAGNHSAINLSPIHSRGPSTDLALQCCSFWVPSAGALSTAVDFPAAFVLPTAAVLLASSAIQCSPFWLLLEPACSAHSANGAPVRLVTVRRVAVSSCSTAAVSVSICKTVHTSAR
jgi:hypothetical protein